MKKNLHLLCAICIIFSLQNTLYSQQFKWAKKGGFYAFDYGLGVGSDNSGNIYISGKYEMDSKFDNVTVSCQGNHDSFTAKYDANGNLVWVRTSGGEWGDYAHASTTDDNGNTYVTGEFELTALFQGTNQSLTTWGSNDIFIAKYNSNGDLIWIRRAGGGKSDQGLAIALSGDAVYVAGKFKESAEFSGTWISSAGDDDTFIAKYDLDGNFKWVKRGGGSLEDEAYGVSVGIDGNIYLAGYFEGSAEFGGTTYNGYGKTDIFLAKYDSDGNFKWLKNAGGSQNDHANAVKAGKDGRIYLTGGFREFSKWDNISHWAKLGDLDIFTACYTSDGNVVWVKKAGGNINDDSFAIDVDDNFNSYISGYMGYNVEFGGTSISATDSADIYIASYNANGDLRWVMKAGGTTDDPYVMGTEEAGRAICIDKSGNVIVTGAFRTSAVFGSTTHTGWMHTDVFVTKIEQENPPFSAVIVANSSTTICPGETVKLQANTGNGFSYQWYRDNSPIANSNASSYTANLPGDYHVVTTANSQTETSNTITVTGINACAASFSFKDTLLTVNFTNLSSYADSIIWSFGDGTTSTEQNPSHTYLAEGQYVICLEAINTCGNDTFCQIIELEEDTPTVIKEEKPGYYFDIYPSPTEGFVYIQYNGNESMEVILKAIAITGQIVFEKKIKTISKQPIEINLGEEAAGIYFLKLYTDKEQFIKKIVLKK